MSQKRLYPKCADKMDDLARHLESKYGDAGFQTQTLKIEGGDDKGTVFQMRPKRGGWETFKEWTGMGKAATVTMKAEGDALDVEVGGGKWLDKAAVVGVSMVILWPLAVTASIGALGQRSLLKQVLEDIEEYFRSGAISLKCRHCGGAVQSEAKFCSECGEAVK